MSLAEPTVVVTSSPVGRCDIVVYETSSWSSGIGEEKVGVMMRREEIKRMKEGREKGVVNCIL